MNASSYSILFVDDDTHLREIMAVALKRKGYNIHAEGRMDHAQKWLRSHPKPDLIISDIMMPDGSGFHFYKWLLSQENLKDIPVIVCTCLQDPEMLQDFLDMGAADCLRKPIDMGKLIEKIERIRKKTSRKAD